MNAGFKDFSDTPDKCGTGDCNFLVTQDDKHAYQMENGLICDSNGIWEACTEDKDGKPPNSWSGGDCRCYNNGNAWIWGDDCTVNPNPTPTECQGNIVLTLDPSTVAPAGSVTLSASASELSNCDNKVVYFVEGLLCLYDQQGSIQSVISFCTIPAGGTGCTPEPPFNTFTAPNTPDIYFYSACIDKNGDKEFLDASEIDGSSLIVSNAP